MEENELVVAMGAWDELSAELIERAGYGMVSLQSFQYNLSTGVPDWGLRTPRDLLNLTWRVANVVDLPILVDFESGWGEAPHTVYWMREFERAGASMLHINDELRGVVHRCPHFPGPGAPTPDERMKLLPDIDELAGKIKAMVETREEGIMISARTYGRTREDQIKRLKVCREAGADALWTSGRANRDDLIRARKELEGPLIVQSWAPGQVGAKSLWENIPDLKIQELQEMGYSIFNFAHIPLIPYKGFMDLLRKIKDSDSLLVAANMSFDWEELLDIVGYNKMRELFEKYGVRCSAVG